jgi:hypothetical protein
VRFRRSGRLRKRYVVLGHALYAVAFDIEERCGKPLLGKGSNVTRYARACGAPRDNQDENVAAGLIMPMLMTPASVACLARVNQDENSASVAKSIAQRVTIDLITRLTLSRLISMRIVECRWHPTAHAVAGQNLQRNALRCRHSVTRDNQDENSASVGEVDCVTRDDGLDHTPYALAFDLDVHCRSVANIQYRQPFAEQSQ